ncbi:MAG: transglutaminase [Thermoclostridium sp.]|nr:transglutaminase [Thermoclostridium sp.]
MKKRNYKAIISGLLAFILLMQCVPMAFATENRSLDALYPAHLLPAASFQGQFTAEVVSALQRLPAAQALQILNVLRGSGGDLMLERTANRMEGAAMLVRLLGAEKDALTGNYSHPFTDVDPWASPYIGYLYENSLTNGIGNNLYGSGLPMNEKAYLTFLLRALGYSDRNGLDFTWDTVEQASRETGLLYSAESFSEDAPFKRERLAVLSWRAMFLNHRTREKLLLAYLNDQKMITDESLEGLLEADNSPGLDQWFVYLPQLVAGLRNQDEKIELLQAEAIAQTDLEKYGWIMMERAQHESGVFVEGYLLESWLEGEDYKLIIMPRYVNSIQQQQVQNAWVEQLVDDIIQPGMSDYEKVKTVHNFLITALQYDRSKEPADSSYHAFGALDTGKAVCGAYAELMVLLLNKAGVPCRMVTGIGNGIDHAWNMVLIDGEPYHVDTTWDDPVTQAEGIILRYEYFNLNDEEMKREHAWTEKDYPACSAAKENYFIKENLVLSDAAALRKALRETLNQQKTLCMFRLNGFTVSNESVNDMMSQVNEQAGYVISSYRFSYNEAMNVILIEAIEYN